MAQTTEEQFATWWATHEPELRAALRGFPEIDDALQETAIRVLHHISSNPEITDSPNLLRLARVWARGKALDRLRTETRRRGLLTRWLPARHVATVEEEAATRQLLDRVRRIAAELPGKQGAVMSALLDGQSYADIARTTGTGPSTVRSLARHARLRLAERLERDDLRERS